MNRAKYLGIALAMVFSLFLIFSQTVYASIDIGASGQAACAYYIDAGTGSIIVQVLVGSFVGLVAIAGVYRVRVKNFLRNLFKKRKSDEESE
jgi:ABC-type long-subunit fatty acid transport system fused permease/ATPase subunit